MEPKLVHIDYLGYPELEVRVYTNARTTTRGVTVERVSYNKVKVTLEVVEPVTTQLQIRGYMSHVKTEILTYIFDQGEDAQMEVSFQRIPGREPSVTVVTHDQNGAKTIGKGDFNQADLDALLELAEEWNS